jgi:hypothetical protein
MVTAVCVYFATYRKVCHSYRSLIYPHECPESIPFCLPQHTSHRTRCHMLYRDTSRRCRNDMPMTRTSNQEIRPVTFLHHRAQLPPRCIDKHVRSVHFWWYLGYDSQSVIQMEDFNFKIKGSFERRNWMIYTNAALCNVSILEDMSQARKVTGSAHQCCLP